MKVLNIKAATPSGYGIITTADKYTEEECTVGGIIDTTKLGVIKDMQKIVSASTSAIGRGFTNDKLVLLDFSKYMKTTQKKDTLKSSMDEHYMNNVSFEIPMIHLDGSEHLLVDIDCITLTIDDHEWIEDTTGDEIESEIILN